MLDETGVADRHEKIPEALLRVPLRERDEGGVDDQVGLFEESHRFEKVLPRVVLVELPENPIIQRLDSGRDQDAAMPLQIAEETCHRIAIIHHGRVAALGTVDELRRQLSRDGASLEEIFLEMTDPRD